MKKNISKIGTLLLSLILILSCSGCGKEEVFTAQEKTSGIVSDNTSDELKLVSENGKVSLWLNPSNCSMILHNDKTVYTPVADQLPAVIAESEIASKLQSHLLVSYVNDTNNSFVAMSSVSSVRRETYKIENIDNGVRITFDFSREKERFVIPVEYTLLEDGFAARICTEDIVEYGTNRIVSISLLPGFLSGTSEEDGSLFIPDGSGALVGFSPENDSAVSVKLDMFGRDPALGLSKVSSNKNDCRLPVFGMNKHGSGVLAVIEDGAALSTIVCNPSTKSAQAANVYSEFRYRALDTVVLADQSFKAKTTTVLSTTPESTDFSVRYFLDNGSEDYTSLAMLYRNYLSESKTVSERRLYIEAYGAVKKKTSILGMVYDKVTAVTDFEDLIYLSNMIDKETDLPITYLLKGFQSGGYGAGVNKEANLIGKIGGNIGLKDLKGAIGESDRIYLNGEFAAENRVSIFGSYAKSIYNEVLLRQTYSLSKLVKNNSRTKPFVKSADVVKNATAYLDSMKKLPIDGIYFTDIGSELYSDFDKKGFVSRVNAVEIQTQLLEKASEQCSVSVSNANVYAFSSATAVINVPYDSSKYLIETRSVPFTQLALSGITELVGEPLNSEADIERAFIMNSVFGMSIQMRVTGKSNYDFKDTELYFLYDTEINGREKIIKEYTTRFAEISDSLGNSIIVDCDSPEYGIYRVTYSNGTVLTANATKDKFIWNDEILPSLSIAINK